jgi:hypothetical protein
MRTYTKACQKVNMEKYHEKKEKDGPLCLTVTALLITSCREALRNPMLTSGKL